MKDFLSEQQRRELRLQHRTERDGRVRDRLKALVLCDKRWTYRQIGEALMIDEESVSRHIHDYLNQNKLKPENGGSSCKLNVSQTANLLNHLYPLYFKILARHLRRRAAEPIWQYR